MSDTADNEVRLVFRPLRDSVPWPNRVRHLLKFALRALKLRCVRVEGLPDVETPGSEIVDPERTGAI